MPTPGSHLYDQLTLLLFTICPDFLAFCPKALAPGKQRLHQMLLGQGAEGFGDENPCSLLPSKKALIPLPPPWRCSRATPCCSQMLPTDFLFIGLVWSLMEQKANELAGISTVLIKLRQHGAHRTFSHFDKCMLIAFCLLANYSNSSGFKKFDISFWLQQLLVSSSTRKGEGWGWEQTMTS